MEGCHDVIQSHILESPGYALAYIELSVVRIPCHAHADQSFRSTPMKRENAFGLAGVVLFAGSLLLRSGWLQWVLLAVSAACLVFARYLSYMRDCYRDA
jgi:hypothetical protein